MIVGKSGIVELTRSHCRRGNDALQLQRFSFGHFALTNRQSSVFRREVRPHPRRNCYEEIVVGRDVLRDVANGQLRRRRLYENLNSGMESNAWRCCGASP